MDIEVEIQTNSEKDYREIVDALEHPPRLQGMRLKVEEHDQARTYGGPVHELVAFIQLMETGMPPAITVAVAVEMVKKLGATLRGQKDRREHVKIRIDGLEVECRRGEVERVLARKVGIDLDR